MPTTQREPFFIGELAERTGLSRDTIRYYESAGVLPEPERSESGYRLYRSHDVERISFIGQAQALGLTLEEIAEVLDIVDEGREPCVHVRDRLSTRLEETRDRLRHLRALESRLVETLRRVDGDPPPSGCRCGIIESVKGRPAPAGSPLTRPRGRATPP